MLLLLVSQTRKFPEKSWNFDHRNITRMCAHQKYIIFPRDPENARLSINDKDIMMCSMISLFGMSAVDFKWSLWVTPSLCHLPTTNSSLLVYNLLNSLFLTEASVRPEKCMSVRVDLIKPLLLLNNNSDLYKLTHVSHLTSLLFFSHREGRLRWNLQRHPHLRVWMCHRRFEA